VEGAGSSSEEQKKLGKSGVQWYVCLSKVEKIPSGVSNGMRLASSFSCI